MSPRAGRVRLTAAQNNLWAGTHKFIGRPTEKTPDRPTATPPLPTTLLITRLPMVTAQSPGQNVDS